MRRRVVDSEFHWSISFFPVRSALESALFQATEEVALEAAEEDDDRDKRDERAGGNQSRILDEHALESVHAEGQGVLAFIGDRDQRPQEVVPGTDECEDADNGHRAFDLRYTDVEEPLP